jgi:hypothetical protein
MSDGLSKTRRAWHEAQRAEAETTKRMWVMLNALERHGVPDTNEVAVTRIEWRHNDLILACVESFPSGILYRLRVNALLYPFPVEDYDKAALAIKACLEKFDYA